MNSKEETRKYQGKRLVNAEYEYMVKLQEKAGFELQPTTELGINHIPYLGNRFVVSNNHVVAISLKDYRYKWNKFPNEIFNFTELKELYLSMNEITLISERIRELSNLEVLDLSANQLKDLPKELESLSNLRVLNLSSNQIQQLPLNIGNLDNLEDLILNHNPLELLPVSMENLKKIKYLDMCNIGLKKVPEWLQRLKNLRHLDISKNPIDNLEKLGNIPSRSVPTKVYEHLDLVKPEKDALVELEKRTGLELPVIENSKSLINSNSLMIKPNHLINLKKYEGGNIKFGIAIHNQHVVALAFDNYRHRLKEFPDEILEFIHIKELYLPMNEIKTIPKEIQRFQELEILDLSSLLIQEIPDEIGQLKQLKMLDLGENQLKKLPDTIGNLANLEKLILSKNPLGRVPTSMNNLKKMEYIFMNYMGLEEVPRWLWELNNLKEVDISNNKFKEIPKDINKIVATGISF